MTDLSASQTAVAPNSPCARAPYFPRRKKASRPLDRQSSSS